MPTTGASARRAGHRWELAVARWLNDDAPFGERGDDGVPTRFRWTTTRNAAPGSHDDVGDLLDPLGRYAIECKDVARLSVQATFDIIERKAERHDLTPVLVVKRRQRPTEDGLVIVRLRDWNR